MTPQQVLLLQRDVFSELREFAALFLNSCMVTWLDNSKAVWGVKVCPACAILKALSWLLGLAYVIQLQEVKKKKKN